MNPCGAQASWAYDSVSRSGSRSLDEQADGPPEAPFMNWMRVDSSRAAPTAERLPLSTRARKASTETFGTQTSCEPPGFSPC